MKKSIRLIGMFFSAFIISVLFSINTSIRADVEVEINSSNFPDDNFRAIVATYNKDGNNFLDETEINNVVNMYIGSKKIGDLSGIEFFKSLKQLDCSNNYLSSINLQNNTALTYLDCSGNNLSSLYVGKNDQLRFLYCSGNKLTALDIKNSKIESLKCDSNKLTSLIVKSNAYLQKISCTNNNLTSIDFSGCKSLVSFEVDSTYLKNLNVSGCEQLSHIHLVDNNLVSLNASGCVNLRYINCYNNKMTGINLKGCTSLASLDCRSNQLTSLNIDDCVNLDSLICDSNNIGKLNVSNNQKLTNLECSHNSIGSLNVKNNLELTELSCAECNLSALDVSNNKKLRKLDCSKNQISKLNLKNCPDLESFVCSENMLEKLDISNNPYLYYLLCATNQFSFLDISNNLILQELYLKGNKHNYYSSVEYTATVDGVWERLWFDSDVALFPFIVTATPTKAPTASLSLNKSSAIVVCGGNLTLKATVKGTNSAVSWKSSNTKIAPVSAGKVTAKQAGVVTITATVAGKSATCKVTVLYKDVTDSRDFWYAPTNYLTAAGVVKGYDNQTLFKPANDCSRAQMVTFLWRLSGEPKPKSTTTDFTDIKTSDYFYKPVLWAVEKGITTGVSKTKFDPQAICTRAQTVTFLWRMAGKPEPKSSSCKFTDVTSKDYFYKPTIWASEMKIVAGYDDNTFKPQGKCLRRQMVTFLYKYDKYVNGKG